jgi:hypothetical protein
MDNYLSVLFENINFCLEIWRLQFATKNIAQHSTDITIKIKDIFVYKSLIRMEIILGLMWRINKEISVSECSLNRIIGYVWRTVSTLTTSGHFGHEGKRLEFLALNVWMSIM